MDESVFQVSGAGLLEDKLRPNHPWKKLTLAHSNVGFPEDNLRGKIPVELITSSSVFGNCRSVCWPADLKQVYLPGINPGRTKDRIQRITKLVPKLTEGWLRPRIWRTRQYTWTVKNHKCSIKHASESSNQVFPGSPQNYDSMLPMQGAWVQSQAGEVTSHMPHGGKRKRKKKKSPDLMNPWEEKVERQIFFLKLHLSLKYFQNHGFEMFWLIFCSLINYPWASIFKYEPLASQVAQR